MKRRRVDDPIRLVLANDPRDTDPIGHVDVTMGEPNGAIAKCPHQILAELAGAPDDQCPHAGTPLMIVSFSQRMLKKRGSFSGSRPKSPRSRASQIETTASVM